MVPKLIPRVQCCRRMLEAGGGRRTFSTAYSMISSWMKGSIAKYYRTKRFRLSIIRYILRDL
jgi:hypothetical protein